MGWRVTKVVHTGDAAFISAVACLDDQVFERNFRDGDH